MRPFKYEKKEQATKYKECDGACHGSLYLFRSALVSPMISHLLGIINRDDNNRV